MTRESSSSPLLFPSVRLKGLDVKAVQDLAIHIGTWLQPGISLCLIGDLGAGKTTFCRFLIQAICPQVESVPSPTFSLIQPYEKPNGQRVWHCDFYRLRHPEEWKDLGLEDAYHQESCLIEWPNKAFPFLPPCHLTLAIEGEGGPQDSQESLRSIQIEGRLPSSDSPFLPVFKDLFHDLSSLFSFSSLD